MARIHKRAESVAQNLTPGSFRWATALLAGLKRLTGDELALVLECNPEKPLSSDLRNYAIKFLRGRCALKRPGNVLGWPFQLVPPRSRVVTFGALLHGYSDKARVGACPNPVRFCFE